MGRAAWLYEPETKFKEDEITAEALEFLRQRLENHSFSITYKSFPLGFSREGEAKVSDSEISIPIPATLEQSELEFLYAMQIHESAHVLYSSLEFEKVNNFFREQKMNINLAQDLFNIIEDYRVNVLIGVSHPGAGRIMDYVHTRLVKERIDRFGPYTSAREALCAELCGYPNATDFNETEKEKLEKACDLCYGVVLSRDLDSTLKVLPAVYELFKDEAKETAKPDGSEGECEGEDGKFGEGFYTSSDDGDSDGAPCSTADFGGKLFERRPTRSDRDVKKSLEKVVEKIEKEMTSPKEMSEEKRKEKTPEETEREKKEFRDIKKVFEEVKKIQVKAVEKEKKKLEKLKISEKAVREKHPAKYTHRFERTQNRAMYERYVRKYETQINKLVREIKTMTLFSRGYQSGQRTGKLNGKKVYRLVTSGDSKIFKKKVDNKEVGDLAVLLLQDLSGSMRDVKIDNSLQACIILHEVFRRLKIKHMIVGYTADLDGRSTDHIVYKYWEDTLPAYNIPEMEAISQNRDGAYVRLATTYFDGLPERNKLLIIISDGAPAADGYGGSSGIKDTVEAHKEAVKKGIKFINIGINYHLPEQYENKVRVDNVENLPVALLKVLRKELLK
jgi:hypothetical protein